MSPFSFSLSHTLTAFLSISSHGLHLLKLKLSLVFLSQWLNGSLASTLCFYFCFPQGRMAFASFFSFSSTCPTHLLSFASLLIKRSQTFPCMLSFALNQRADFVGLRRQAHKWVLTSKWAGPTQCLHPTNLSTRMKR